LARREMSERTPDASALLHAKEGLFRGRSRRPMLGLDQLLAAFAPAAPPARTPPITARVDRDARQPALRSRRHHAYLALLKELEKDVLADLFGLVAIGEQEPAER